jgi:hypothetical protein
MYIKNYGKEPAYDLVADRWFKGISGHYEHVTERTKHRGGLRLTIEKHLLPPGATTFFEAISECDISEDQYNALLMSNRGIGILTHFTYTDYSRSQLYYDWFCLEWQSNGVSVLRDEDSFRSNISSLSPN